MGHRTFGFTITSMDGPELMNRRVNPSGPPIENAARTARSSIRPGKPTDEAWRIQRPSSPARIPNIMGVPKAARRFSNQWTAGPG